MEQWFPILAALYALACFAELGAYWFAFERLAWAAVLPLGPPRHIPLPREKLEALMREVPGGGGYRDGSSRVLDLERLALAPEIGADDVVARPRLARGFVALRLPFRFFAFNRALAVGRVDVRPAPGGLEARARFAPVPLLSFVALAPMFFLAALLADPSRGAGAALGSALGAAVFMLMFGLIFGIAARGRMKRAAEWVGDCIESAALDAARRSNVRVVAAPDAGLRADPAAAARDDAAGAAPDRVDSAR